MAVNLARNRIVKEPNTELKTDIKFVSLETIVNNSLNSQFEISDIETLADSIMRNGLMQPLTVYRDNSTEEERYILISGERRWRSLNYIKDTYPEEYIRLNQARNNQVPVLVYTSLNDAVTEEIMLIEANTTGRKENPQVMASHYVRLLDLYRAMEEKGDKRYRSISKRLSDTVGISLNEAKRYKYLSELPEDLIEKVYEGKISIGAASALHSSTKEELDMVRDALDNSNTTITEKSVAAIKKNRSETIGSVSPVDELIKELTKMNKVLERVEDQELKLTLKDKLDDIHILLDGLKKPCKNC